MGDSHIKSNLIGKNGTETISNFATITATTFVGNLTGDVTGDVNADSYVKIGTNKVIAGGTLVTEASIITALRALSASPGSLYMGTANVWLLDGSNSAATIALQ